MKPVLNYSVKSFNFSIRCMMYIYQSVYGMHKLACMYLELAQPAFFGPLIMEPFRPLIKEPFGPLIKKPPLDP